MSIIQAIVALITRSAGRILNAIFGWAVHALFGRTSARDQTTLSAIVGAAVAWPILALGVALPKIAAFVFARVPLPRSVPSSIVRIVWLVLAGVVPLVLGLAIAAKGRVARRGEPVVKRLLRGFPLTLGVAFAFLIMFVSVPLMRLAALARRENSTDVPLLTDADAYHDVAALIVEHLNRHGFELRAAEPGWWVKAPTRLLALFGGSAFAAFVPQQIEHFEDRSIKISFYASGVVLRGKRQRMTWARALIEEAIVHSEGLETSTTPAQDVERRIRAIWRGMDRGGSSARDAPALLRSFDEVGRALASIDVDYDEWQALYRQALQLDRALRGERPLLGESTPAVPASARSSGEREARPRRRHPRLASE